MKSSIFLIILLGLSLCFTEVNSQSVKGSEIKKTSVVSPDIIPTCVDKLNTGIEFCYDLWILMDGICVTAYPSDPAGLTECQTIADDTNTAMLQTYLNAFNRCSAAQN